MFRDTDKKTWPTEINENTATIIMLNAIEEYIGGEALGSEMEPGNPKTVRAMEDLECCLKCCGGDTPEPAHGLNWRRRSKTGSWQSTGI